MIAHNYYSSQYPSGENRAVDDDIDLLSKGGVSVVRYFRSSDEIENHAYSIVGRVGLARSAIFSQRTYREVRTLMRRHAVDVLHTHNIFPLISPAVYRAATDEGIPIVHTAHNYRYVCLAGTLNRKGRRCELCLEKRSRAPGVLYGCYRNSRVQSAVIGASLYGAAEEYASISKWLVPSDFVREKLLASSSVSPRAVAVRWNTVQDPGRGCPPGGDVLFVGRLDKDKGVRELVEAWTRVLCKGERRLLIVGNGPLAKELAGVAAMDETVVCLGTLSPASVDGLYQEAAFVVVPSLVPETFGRVVAEAFSHGRAVISTNLGALPELVDETVGKCVDPTVEALSDALESMLRDPEESERRGAAARARYLSRYSPDAGLQSARSIYSEVLGGE